MVRITLRSKQQHGTPYSPQFTKTRNNYDNISYVTDTSSITNPLELGLSYSRDSAGDEDVSYFTESDVTSALTGWTSIADLKTPGNMKSFESNGVGGVLSPINETNIDVDEMSVVTNTFGDGSVEARLMHGNNESAMKSTGAVRPPIQSAAKPPRPPTKTIHFDSTPIQDEKRSTVDESPLKDAAPKSVLMSNAPGFIATESNVNSTKNSSPTASLTSVQKKRLPVPPLRDPTMDDDENDEDAMWEQDCNYDINPTMMFQILESGDWKSCVAYLDGKSSENDTWNFKALIGGGRKPDIDKMKSRLKELRSQARTWIVRREPSGVLRWRMLPLHAALVFNAPFDVVLHLYHLYPGAVRCRNDLGMLPLHHVFMHGNEDRVLELFLDVFPEALTVLDDKGRLPMGCTPQDGSENERRSNILDLYSKFQVELHAKTTAVENNDEKNSSDSAKKVTDKCIDISKTRALTMTAPRPGFIPQYMQHQNNYQRPAQPLKPLSILTPSPNAEASLGIAPRYTMTTDFNHVTYNPILAPNKLQQASATRVIPKQATPQEDTDDPSSSSVDKYASMNDTENTFSNANLRTELLKLGGLDTIPEDEPGEKDKGVHKVKNGLRNLFKRKAMASI